MLLRGIAALLVAGTLLPAWCQGEVWQSSWNAFVDVLGPMLQRNATASELRQTFHDKQVRWEGVFSSRSADGTSFTIDLPPRQVTLANGGSTTLSSLTLTPKGLNVSTFRNLQPGVIVRFRTTLCECVAGFPVVAVLQGVGQNAGQFRVGIFTNDAELVTDPGPPALTQPALVNGASFLPFVSARSWVTVRGRDLAQTTRIWNLGDFQNGKLPKSLDGVSVEINGKAASLYFLSPNQINALSPDDDSAGTVPITVRTPFGSTTTTANLQRYAPGLFQFDPDSRKYLAAVHADGVFAGRPGLFGPSVATRPVRPGDRVLLFGSGFGPTTPAVSSDDVFQGAAPLADMSLLRILIGGVPATVEFAGLVSPGLYQFNVVVPDVPGGDQSVVAEIGGVSSQPNTLLTFAGEPRLQSPVPAQLNFQYQIGGSLPAAQTLALTSSDGSVDFAVARSTVSGGNWLSVSAATGITPATLSVSVNPASLAAGTYNGSVLVTSAGPVLFSIPVTLTVTGPPVNLSVAPSSISFTYQAGGPTPGAQALSISTSNLSFSYSIQASTTTGGNWLQVSQASGSTPATVQVSVNPAGLAAGSYAGQLRISSPQASPPQNVAVSLTVAGPANDLNTVPFLLTFTAVSGSTTPQTQTVNVSSSASPLAFTLSASTQSGGGWLSVSPSSGTTAGTFGATVNPTGLAVGSYSGQIIVAAAGASNSPRTLPVTLTITSGGSSGGGTQIGSLSFQYQIGGALPGPKLYTLTSTGGPLTFTTSTSAAWLSVSPGSGITTATLTVTVNPAGLPAGTYSGNVIVNAPQAVNSPLLIAITFGITGPAVSPIPSISNVSASSSSSGVVATNTVSFNFTDGDGDITSAASVKVALGGSFTGCSYTGTGSFLNKAGQTSGSITYSNTFPWKTKITGSLPVMVTLYDAAGRASNTFTVFVSLWYTHC